MNGEKHDMWLDGPGTPDASIYENPPKWIKDESAKNGGVRVVEVPPKVTA